MGRMRIGVTPPLLFLSLLAVLSARAAPNIVVIVSDDQGWRDVSYHGSEIRTPAIDRIAREGVELDRFYVCPVCSPTRAGLMTGRYPIRFGMQRAVCRPFLDVGVPPDEDTLAEALGRIGYTRRAAVGKWHIGHGKRRYHPLNQGFSSFYGHYNGNIDYFTHIREGQLDWHDDFDASRDEGYSTDLIADRAVEFISDHSGDDPFFLYVAFNAPHTPLQVPPKWLDRYADITDEKRRTYAGMIAAMDHGIGRILDTIDAAEITDNTLVWFLCDNGGASVGDNRPLRAGKGTVYEGGTRVASALRWPGVLEAGERVDARITYIDVLPTLLAAAGADVAAIRRGQPTLDGSNRWPAVRGRKSPAPKPFYSYFERYAGESLSVIDGRWKLVRNGPPLLGPNPADAPPQGMEVNNKLSSARLELFDIEADPHETRDLSAGNHSKVSELLDMLKEFRGWRADGGVPPMTAPDPPGWKAPVDWEIPEP